MTHCSIDYLAVVIGMVVIAVLSKDPHLAPLIHGEALAQLTFINRIKGFSLDTRIVF